MYCCIAIQRARDTAPALYCPIQQDFVLYCCRARCIGFALHWRGDGGHGWSDRHVDASLSLAMLSWVPLDCMLGVGSHSDPPRLPYDHDHHRLRAPSQCVLSRIAVERAALLYSKIQHKSCCIGQYSAGAVSRARCIAMQQYSAIQLIHQCSNTSQYSIQHNTIPLRTGPG